MRIEWPDGTSEIIDFVVPTVAEARKLIKEGVVNGEELLLEAKAAVAAAAEQKIVDEVFAEVTAGKIENDDVFDVIDARLIAAGLKKKSDLPWGTIVYDEARPSWIGIPFDSAEYLDGPVVPLRNPLMTLRDGTVVDLNSPSPFDDHRSRQ